MIPDFRREISNILLNIKDMSFFGRLSTASCVIPVRWNRMNQSSAKRRISFCVSVRTAAYFASLSGIPFIAFVIFVALVEGQKWNIF